MMRVLVLLCVLACPASAFNPIVAASTLIGGSSSRASTSTGTSLEVAENAVPVKRVAVIGATGRTGRYVVQELLDRGVEEVVAVVRSKSKATETFGKEQGALKFVECDLANPKSITKALQNMEATIWCATGFSSQPSILDRLKSLVGVVTKQSIDLLGLPVVAQVMQDNTIGKGSGNLPNVVMCSSAGVTRPTWDEDKKEKFKGSADIPIVRLNPFGILDIKRESEAKLRSSGVPYCIIRPAGLNDDWPAGSRPILSQGDVAVGRINRKDVAALLVDVLSEPAATGKTMELIGLCNYPKATSITSSLERLSLDSDGEIPLEQVAATYAVQQQMLPGETQDAAALAMGQTYEQLDKGETGRLGERGKEDAEAAAPKPTSV